MPRFTRAEKDAFAERMRRNPTGSEALLYDRLRPYGFLSQQNVLGWIVDLLQPDERVVVEVDGPSHNTDEALTADVKRDAAMISAGYAVVRIRWWRVIQDPDECAAWVLDFFTDPRPEAPTLHDDPLVQLSGWPLLDCLFAWRYVNVRSGDPGYIFSHGPYFAPVNDFTRQRWGLT